jgi:hypothetical protein
MRYANGAGWRRHSLLQWHLSQSGLPFRRQSVWHPCHLPGNLLLSLSALSGFSVRVWSQFC